ncbi:hypothetical protein GeomeDRAFT_0791 [Geobacter metallireducens RCH3]|uniref:DUF3300 domain-containing protein n=1 Tax=Geobacter metallireducens (strain ATCC 53774 / DSM 7210 / GS-15) TaxID=269799 RepID=Q39WD8_GEOMG|nr:DUF3300 domain-containing protein [Geobacter metallireducens]ABB31436.2 hypothetical protein Gmet_1199 [Geobacter metallireducens GS-15]EHP88478.1 hypothetical protein GeomeDRAFT_0791 [Geobacter metallireducens RCH3]
MKATIMTILKVACIVIVMLAMPVGTMAQEGEADQAAKFSKQELTQMLAPIALYPDSLIAQVLMASTYPLELVEAERWRRDNMGLKGTELDNALQNKPWDPSVKSLCHFPDVLFALSDKLDQTRKLGDAFLSQEDDVMASIQELRQKAEQQGNLKTTSQQKVVEDQGEIQIEPVDPEVIYVPVYDPSYIYGPWWYPDYPPYYWYYPTSYPFGLSYIAFGPPFYFSFNIFSWAWCDWRSHRIHVDFDRTRRFNRFNTSRDLGGSVWRHNPVHRRGVAYRDIRTGERFGLRPTRVSPAGPETRGYPVRGQVRPGLRGTQAPAGRVPEQRERAVVPQREQGPAVRQAPVERREGTTVTPRIQAPREQVQRPAGRDTPFRGVGEGTFERRAINRGEMSIRSGTPPMGRSRGGFGGEIRQPSGGFRGGEIRQPAGGGFRGGEIRQPSGGGSRGGGRR